MFNLFKNKKKLITGEDGKLYYPHSFKVGQMVNFKVGYSNLDGFVGLGIITEATLEDIVVYWQNSGNYKKYTVAAATLTFETIEQ